MQPRPGFKLEVKLVAFEVVNLEVHMLSLLHSEVPVPSVFRVSS